MELYYNPKEEGCLYFKKGERVLKINFGQNRIIIINYGVLFNIYMDQIQFLDHMTGRGFYDLIWASELMRLVDFAGDIMFDLSSFSHYIRVDRVTRGVDRLVKFEEFDAELKFRRFFESLKLNCCSYYDSRSYYNPYKVDDYEVFLDFVDFLGSEGCDSCDWIEWAHLLTDDEVLDLVDFTRYTGNYDWWFRGEVARGEYYRNYCKICEFLGMEREIFKIRSGWVMKRLMEIGNFDLITHYYEDGYGLD